MAQIRKGTFGKHATTAGKEVSVRHVDKNAPRDPKGNLITNQLHGGVSKTLVNHTGKTVRAKGELPGGVHADAYAQGPSLKVGGSASARATSFKSFDVAVNLNVDAKAIKAGASITKEFPFEVEGEKFKVKVKLGPDGYVGANGSLNLHLKVSPTGVRVQLAANGFAGARGALTGTVEISGGNKKLVTAQTKVTFGAGVGAGASLDVGPGRFHANAYAVAGVGVGLDMKGSVDAKNMLTELPHLLPDDIEKKVDDTVDTAKDVVADAQATAKNVVADAKGTAKNVVTDAKGTAKNVVTDARAEAREDVARAKRLGHDGFEGAKSAAGKAKNAVSNAASKLNPFD